MLASLLFKIIILILFLLILASLGGGLFFLARDQGKSRRVIYSLSFRAGLSIALFMLLIIGYFTGLINPHDIEPANTQQDRQQ